MLTVYVDPLAYFVAKVLVVFVVKDNESALSSCTTSVPTRPTVLTLRLKFVTQVAVTVMFDVMVPVALLLSVQVCVVGCV
jgi:hypothetical protein